MSKDRRTHQELTALRRCALAEVEAAGRRYSHEKSGRLYYVTDVVFTHTESGLQPAYTYYEIIPFGEHAPFVRPISEFLKRFRHVPRS